MPVLAEHQNLGHQATASSHTSAPSYFFISLAIISILGFSISRRKRSNCETGNTSNSVFGKRKTSDARMMQEPTSGSALPEKPYLLDSESMSHGVEHQLQPSSSLSPEPSEQEPPSSDSSLSAQDFPRNERINSSKHQSPHQHHVSHSSITKSLLFHKRPGSLSSLTPPEPPSPTIGIAPININTQVPFQSQPQPQNYQFDGQPQYQGQYMQNEILFVPSPTEYTSFEALYSNFSPLIYHSPNPTSYTSITSDEPSSSPATHQSSSFSTKDGNPDYAHGSTLPRRRSYTKTLSNGSEMSGEIIVSSGSGEGAGKGGVGLGQWRRHTRVFGGGVCMACEESESRRMTA